MGEKRSRREVALELKGDRVGVSSQPVDQGPPGILKGVELREDGGVMVLVVIKRVCVCVRACMLGQEATGILLSSLTTSRIAPINSNTFLNQHGPKYPHTHFSLARPPHGSV